MCIHVFYTYSSVYMTFCIYTYDIYTQFLLYNSTWTYSEFGSNPMASLECLYVDGPDCFLFSTTINKVRVNIQD